MNQVCSICQEKVPKYTCPACGARTCSLACVTRHKKQTECLGLVDQTQFIPRKDLGESTLHMNRDYNFLLKFGRDIQLGKSDVKNNAKNIFKRQYQNNRNTKRFKTGNDVDTRLETVKKAYPNDPPTTVRRNNTLVIQLPPGMSRATSNKSGFDKKLSSFTWSVEWAVVGLDGKVLKSFISYRLKEHLVLKDAVPMNILNNLYEDKVIDKDQLCFYLDNVVNLKKPQKSVIELEPTSSISLALQDKIVIEYPTVYITLSPDTWKEYVEDQDTAYGLNKDLLSEEDSTDSSDSSDGSETSDSESESGSDSDDDLPEETSSKEPQKIVFEPSDNSV